MAMTPAFRKVALSAHITTSVGMLGAIAAFSALAFTGLNAYEATSIRAAYLAMDVIARWLIAPLALVALLTGIIESLGTPWGLFRHYWIVVKLFLTTFAAAILLFKLDLISSAARLATDEILARDELRGVGTQLTIHALAGLAVLIVPAILSVYKPKGLTPYGRRSQEARREPSTFLNSPSSTPASTLPALITISLNRGHLLAISTALVVVHIAVLHLAGALRGH